MPYINCKDQQFTFNIAAGIMSILVQNNNEIFKDFIENQLKLIC
jgi:hypothetical protein